MLSLPLRLRLIVSYPFFPLLYLIPDTLELQLAGGLPAPFYATPAADQDDSMANIPHIPGLVVPGFVALLRGSYGRKPAFEQTQRDIEACADLL
jgi:hypothetical protein